MAELKCSFDILEDLLGFGQQGIRITGVIPSDIDDRTLTFTLEGADLPEGRVGAFYERVIGLNSSAITLPPRFRPYPSEFRPYPPEV